MTNNENVNEDFGGYLEEIGENLRFVWWDWSGNKILEDNGRKWVKNLHFGRRNS